MEEKLQISIDEIPNVPEIIENEINLVLGEDGKANYITSPLSGKLKCIYLIFNSLLPLHLRINMDVYGANFDVLNMKEIRVSSLFYPKIQAVDNAGDKLTFIFDEWLFKKDKLNIELFGERNSNVRIIMRFE